MRKILLYLLAVLTLNQFCLFASPKHEMPPAYVGSPEFERLKGLTGVWKGSSEMDDEKHEATVEYYVTSNGSAVVEKLFPGTPHEMISVYHDKKGKLAMTHYCGFGNQPQLDLVSSNEKEMKFDFSNSNDIDPAKEDHMHSLTLTFDGKDKLVQNWGCMKGGADAGKTVIVLARAS